MSANLKQFILMATESTCPLCDLPLQLFLINLDAQLGNSQNNSIEMCPNPACPYPFVVRRDVAVASSSIISKKTAGGTEYFLTKDASLPTYCCGPEEEKR